MSREHKLRAERVAGGWQIACWEPEWPEYTTADGTVVSGYPAGWYVTDGDRVYRTRRECEEEIERERRAAWDEYFANLEYEAGMAYACGYHD